MTGQKFTLPKGATVKDGKITLSYYFRDESHQIRVKKSKKVRVKNRYKL